MRLRNNPKAMDILKENKDIVYIHEKYEYQNNLPIHIEIGMGKGDFIIENAKRYQDIQFIGIEKYPTVLLQALKKHKDNDIPNCKLMLEDAGHLLEVFNKHSIDTIYLNFSDPWPKNKHEKRRLTYKSYLDIYKELLKKDGSIIMKTDNRSLFEYTLQSINAYGVHMKDICLDLHHSDYPDNIETEYEKKFSPYGPIYRVEFTFK